MNAHGNARALMLAVWLIAMGGALSRAQGSPILYNATDLGQLIATGFDSDGDVIGPYLKNNVSIGIGTGGPGFTPGRSFIDTASGPNAGAVQVLPNSSMPRPDFSNVALPPGYTDGLVTGANASGQAVGFVVQPAVPGTTTPDLDWLYSNGKYTMLAPQFGLQPLYGPSTIHINASGQVIFGAQVRNPVDGVEQPRAFLYVNGHPTDLGTLPLPGADGASALGINNAGQIVGGTDQDPTSMVLTGSAQHAFLYENGKMYDLNDLIATGNRVPLLYSAFAINDRGQILVSGIDDHDYLLTPSDLPNVPPPPAWTAPEPSTFAFLALTMAALAGRKALRRRRRGPR